jgi:hypothetical protein
MTRRRNFVRPSYAELSFELLLVICSAIMRRTFAWAVCLFLSCAFMFAQGKSKYRTGHLMGVEDIGDPSNISEKAPIC